MLRGVLYGVVAKCENVQEMKKSVASSSSFPIHFHIQEDLAMSLLVMLYTHTPSVSSLPMVGMTRLQSGPSADSSCHTQNCSNESNCKLLAGLCVIYYTNSAIYVYTACVYIVYSTLLYVPF